MDLQHRVLQAVGCTPNANEIATDKAHVALTGRGFVNVDIQMRPNVPHVFASGFGRWGADCLPCRQIDQTLKGCQRAASGYSM